MKCYTLISIIHDIKTFTYNVETAHVSVINSRQTLPNTYRCFLSVCCCN